MNRPPLLRGYIHLGAALVAPFGLVVLLMLAHSPRGYVSAAIFGASLILLFSSSASYHIVPWGRRAKRFMKRVDHSVIFVTVAGLFTPFCLQSMGTAWGITMLSLAWSFAGIGVILKSAFPDIRPWLGVGCYLAAGWLPIIAAPQLAGRLPPASMAALALAGALFTAGGVIYAVKRPNPFPRVFAHHEIFHVLVTAASGAVYLVVAVAVLPA